LLDIVEKKRSSGNGVFEGACDFRCLRFRGSFALVNTCVGEGQCMDEYFDDDRMGRV